MMIATLVLCIFVIGFLLGERRAIRECNSILDHNQKVLLDAFKDVPVLPEEEPHRPSLH